ncbi:TonB-dependent receptor [Sphingomonas sp.]|uniref:TonB-dependent receptor domain-containing protein n=1 Tax=Sphingomonas sp. TaxID=28214 RepID=UPI001B1E295D|nr:TonB-dependent receptor [Sphingomonas sp.]MBO9712876.1 TonB-dependent receptor [Sphingomonas sp.]
MRNIIRPWVARSFAGASLAALALASAMPAQAQDTPVEPAAQGDASVATETTPEDEGAIVVTGSRIRRANFDTVEPSVVLSSDDIERRGFTTLGQALNELPAFGVPGSSPVGGGQSPFGPGQSFVNFLGLGDQRTLTLVNSNRFVSSNTSSLFGPTGAGSQVDLNLIPTELIDRVETIAVGGAPIYGSDAVAGTINVILKRNFKGLTIDAQYGISDQGDYPDYRFRLLAGTDFAGGRGNVTIAAEYNKSAGLIYTDRAATARGLFYGSPNDLNSPFLNQRYDHERVGIVSKYGIPLTSDFFPLDPSPVATPAYYADLFGLDLANPGDAAYAQFLSTQYPSQNALYCGGFGQCGNFTDAQGKALQFDKSGNLVPIDFGKRPGNPLELAFFTSGGSGLDFAELTNLVTPVERYSGVALLNYDLTDGIHFSGEAWLTHSEGENLVDQPVYNSKAFGDAGQPGGNMILSVDNPFLSVQARSIIQAQATGGTFYLARANTDISTREASGGVDVYRFVGGLDGDFEVGARKWNWSVTGNYGRSLTKGHNPEIIEQNFNNAIDAVRDGNGNIVCRPGYTSSPFPTVNTSCAPLNPFGQNVSQAARDYVTAYSDPRSLNQQMVFTAAVTGSLFDLPGGELGIAAGYEHRWEKFDFDPGALLRGPGDIDPTVDSDGDGNPANDHDSYTRDAAVEPVVGSFNTDEFFAEVRAPVVSPSNGVPFVHLLELQGAFRWVDHSVAGGDPTWTIGGRWAPVSDITFRGNFTRSIRSPAVTEIAVPRSAAFFFAVDPCDADELTNGPDPTTRQKNCAAAGIPGTFQSRSNQASFPGVTIGNDHLENEKARAWSVGAVLKPRFVPGLTLSADYIDIHLQNAISFFGSNAVLASCYDSPNYPNNEFCSSFTRSTTPGTSFNQLTFVKTSFFNADRLDYQGVLGDLEYLARTPFLGADSQVGLKVSAQYLKKLEQASGAGAATQLKKDIGYPVWSANTTVSYANSGFLAQMTAVYTSSVYVDANAASNAYPDPLIKQNVFFNLGLSWEVDKRFTLRFAVDNVFDKGFPSPGNGNGGTVTYFPAVLGRYFRVLTAVHF